LKIGLVFRLILVLFPLLIFSTILFAQEGGNESPSEKAISPFFNTLKKTKARKEPVEKRGDGIDSRRGRNGKRIKDDTLEEFNSRPRDCSPAQEEFDQEKPLSPFETYVRGDLKSLDLSNIHQFGYDLFERNPCKFIPSGSHPDPGEFAPPDAIPVGPDYLLGPGDELFISIWGKIKLNYAPIIDSEGKVVFPEIGILYLAGLTFAQAKTHLEKELSRYYRPSEVQTNISMGRLRSIQVYVVGNVVRPGSYALSSFSTIINAVLAAGGPSKAGTMRDMQVKRNGQTVIHFDLYDLLLKGDKTKDLRLLPEDVIWIPPIGPLVGLTGHVKNPAIYELNGETRLLDLIKMAGGLTAFAFEGRVQLQSIKDRRLITHFEDDLIGIDKDEKKNKILKDGDIVRILPVIEEKRVVIVAGAVGTTGEFGIDPGTTTVKEVIQKAGGLLYYAFDHANITRVKATQNGPETEYIGVHLKKALDGDSAHNIPLEMNDYIFVRSIPEWHLYRNVELKGEVLFPGEYKIKRGESLSSLIERAGGFTERAYLKGAVLTRESVKALQKKHLDETITRLEQRMLSGTAETLEKSLSGESGLLQKNAFEQRQILLAKLKAIEPIGRLPIQLKPLDDFKGSFSDIAMEEGDVLFVPEVPSSVQIVGSVYNQGGYLYSDDMTLSDYLKKSGGIGQGADKGEMYILKADGTAVSRRITDRFFFSNTFMGLHLDPGDTIVVPEDIDHIAWLRMFKDIVHILFEVAVTTSVVVRL